LSRINTHNQAEIAAIERDLLLSKKSLIYFGKRFLGGDFNKSETPGFHREMAKNLIDNRIKELSNVCFRGSGKTTLGKSSVLHANLFNQFDDDLNPVKRTPVMTGWVADNKDNCVQNIEFLKMQYEMNQELRYIFGDLIGKKWTEMFIEDKLGNVVRAASIETGLRGKTKANIEYGTIRFGRIIYDDIESEKNTITPEQRLKIRRTVDNNCHPALESWGRTIKSHTPVHADSICQEDINLYNSGDTGGMVVNVYPVKKRDGTLQWPDYFNQERIDYEYNRYRRKNNIGGFYQEYMLEVFNDEEAQWTRDHIQYHNHTFMHKDGINFLIDEKKEKIPVNCFLGSDPATDLAGRTDDTCIMVIAIDADNKAYVLEYIANNTLKALTIKSSGEKSAVDYIFDLYYRYHCTGGTIENVGITRGLINALEAEKMTRNKFPNISYMKPENRQHKHDRIKDGPINTRLNARAFYIRKDMTKLEDQILRFGPKMAHDDVVETAHYALQNTWVPDFCQKDDTWETETWKPKLWKGA